MRTLVRAALLALACGATSVVFAAPAAADLKGPCEASGTFLKSKVEVDARTAEGTIEIEPEDTVEYVGTVTGATPPRKTSGEVKVDLPFPLPDFKPGEWSDDDSSETEKTDRYDYDIPAFAPRGYDVEVSGFHQDGSLPKCEGSVTLRVKGGFFSGPAGPVAFVITLLSAAGVVISARPKGAGGGIA
ncbi:MAG TPA: hypothetical protein VMQ81_08765 [Acidimicrobiia bacterium]|nr:hypothetical protein [Acidimicrobiia bacterium]